MTPVCTNQSAVLFYRKGCVQVLQRACFVQKILHVICSNSRLLWMAGSPFHVRCFINVIKILRLISVMEHPEGLCHHFQHHVLWVQSGGHCEGAVLLHQNSEPRNVYCLYCLLFSCLSFSFRMSVALLYPFRMALTT